MKKARLSAVLAAVSAFAMLCTACSSGSSSSGGGSVAASGAAADRGSVTLTSGQIPSVDDVKITEGQTLKIGYLAQNETDQFCVLMGEAIEDEAAKYGKSVKLEMSDGQGQAAIQVSQAEDMISKGCDAVIISAVDQDACAPAVQKVVDAGIPMIILNTVVSNTDIASCYVGVDDVDAGKNAMQIIAELIGDEGTINILQGQLGHPANENRITGLEAELENHPNITIGATQAADWDRNKAMNVAEDWISSGAQIDGVVAMNDEMAISVANAFQAAGLTDVKIVGIDALQEALEMIDAGKMHGTVFQDADAQGRAALNLAVAAALGGDLDDEYIIPFEQVTFENHKDYMDANNNLN